MTPSKPRGSRRKRPGVPDADRKRVRVACIPCRRNKLRCNGLAPCERCAGSKRQCLYEYMAKDSSTAAAGASSSSSTSSTPVATPRQPQQEAGFAYQDAEDSSTNEQRLRLLQRLLCKAHPCAPFDIQSLRHYVSAVEAGTLPPHGSAAFSSPAHASPEEQSGGHWGAGGNESRRAWVAGSQDSAQDETLIDTAGTDRAASMTVVSEGETHFEGNSSLWSFFSTVKQALPGRLDRADDGDEATCGAVTVHQIASTINFLGIDWRMAALSALPPRNVVEFLTSSFFRLAQSNYFCLHPEIFSRELTAFYRGPHEFETSLAALSKKSIEFIAVLFMVLAIGSQFAEVGEPAEPPAPNQDALTLEALLAPPCSRSAGYKIPVPAQSPGWLFYEVSHRLLPDLVCSSTMASVQVCALQGIFLPSTTHRDAGYNMLGLALRMAVNMGLHRSFATSTDSLLHAHVRELRNRLWWSVYVVDRLYCSEMGRPLSIGDAEVDAPMPVEVPEWTDGCGRPERIDGFIALVGMSKLLGRIVDGVYGKSSAGAASKAVNGGATIRPKVFQEIKADLDLWRKNLPAHLSLDNNNNNNNNNNNTNPVSRTMAYLALMQEQATILLTRSCLSGAAGLSVRPGASLPPEAVHFLRQQVRECVSAANSSIQIMSALRARGLLCPFSFHDAIYCSSALYVLLFASRRLSDVVSVPQERINQGILVLFELAKGSEAAASTLGSIINVMTSEEDCNDHSIHVPTDSATHYSSMNENNRLAWRAWISAQADGSMSAQFSHLDGEDATTTEMQGMPPQAHVDTGTSSILPHSMYIPTVQDTISTTGLDMSDITPFWIPEQLDFNFLPYHRL